MKRVLTRLLGFALIACLIAFALAPVAAGQYRLWREGQIVDEYRRAADGMTPLDSGTMLSEARSHSQANGPLRLSDPFGEDGGDDGDAAYRELLNPVGNGVMAVLEIPKLGAPMPVYHGVRDAALGAGVGHLPQSALPVGDVEAPCVLAARRGGWFGGPFARLERLIPGDCFDIRALQDTLTFQVTRVVTVPAEALAAQESDPDGETCVLMTTPWGAEDDRLLVYGSRVSRRAVQSPDDTQRLPEWSARLIFAAPVAAAGLIALAVIESIRRMIRRHRRKRMKI